jgi:DNA-binding NarL/FixJ family response regulator
MTEGSHFSRTSVVVVDDHPFLRLGVRRSLATSPLLEVVGEAADGEEALSVVRQIRPDVVVLDLQLPHVNGLDVMRALHDERPELKFVAYSLREEPWVAQEAMSAGASAYVCKSSPADELVSAVEQAAEAAAGPARAVVSRAAPTDKVVAPPPKSLRLSEREAAVLQFLARGVTLKEAAARLNIGVRTLETYRARGMHKLQLRSRVDLMRFAEHSGWLLDAEERPRSE